MRNSFCSLIFCSLAAPAFASSWVVDAAQSTLTFEASQAGESFHGGFSRFTPVIDFDPTHPELGQITVTIDMASVTVEGRDRTDALPGPDWLSVAQFPTATFRSRSIARMADNQFQATGDLTLRGVTRPLALSFALSPEGNATLATGSASLNRSDYGVGQGRWADAQWVAFPVSVHFRLLATPR